MTKKNSSETVPEALSTERLQTLVDGVLAILLTLLVLELRAPLVATTAARDLWVQLGQLWPKFFSFLISFVVLAIFWFGHRMEFHYIRHGDRLLIWITMLWLLVLTCIPFAASLLGNNPRNPAALVVYGANMALAGLVRWGHWRYATQGHRLVGADMSPRIIRLVSQRFSLIPALYGVAIGLAYVHTGAAMALLALLPWLYIPAPKEDQHLTSLKPKTEVRK